MRSCLAFEAFAVLEVLARLAPAWAAAGRTNGLSAITTEPIVRIDVRSLAAPLALIHIIIVI